MTLDDAATQDFLTNGFTLIDDVISIERTAQVDETIETIYGGWSDKTNGILSYCHHPGLFDLYQEPNLERIAQHILGTEEVVLNSASILFERPQPDKAFSLIGEHVDIMFSRDDWLASPRRILCMIIVMIADLPEGRGNTYVRPGSHMQLANWLEAEGREPVKANPTPMKDLPDLPWAEPQPVVARRGQALAFNTNVIHAASVNIDSEARRIMFVNFCPKGMMNIASGNHDRRPVRTEWRNLLRTNFRLERRHLLDDEEA